jgi:hypothetical protein
MVLILSYCAILGRCWRMALLTFHGRSNSHLQIFLTVPDSTERVRPGNPYPDAGHLTGRVSRHGESRRQSKTICFHRFEDRSSRESLSATQPQSQSDSRIERCTCVSKHFRLAQSALTEPLTNLTSCSTEATSVSARKNRPKGSVTGLGIHRSR